MTWKNSFQARPVFFPVLGIIRVYEVFFNSGINTVFVTMKGKIDTSGLFVICSNALKKPLRVIDQPF